MKRFKFRFFDEDLDSYFYSDAYDSLSDFFYDFEDCHGPATLEQSTGLFDKNGNEIFVGDILKVKDRMENTTIDCKVQFESGSFKAIPLEDGDLAYIMYYASQNGEIIGNIREGTQDD